jgi:hypothetical protein
MDEVQGKTLANLVKQLKSELDSNAENLVSNPLDSTTKILESIPLI